MRKLLVVVIAMMFLVATGDVGDTLAADGVIKAIIDFPGDGDISDSGYSVTADIDAGVGIGFDVLFDSAEMFDIGIGFIYQFPRSVEDDAGKANFMPIYLVGKGYFTDENQQVRPYLYGHLGYNFFFGDDDFTGSADLEGGLYYSVGLGLLFNNKFLIEAGLLTFDEAYTREDGRTGYRTTEVFKRR